MTVRIACGRLRRHPTVSLPSTLSKLANDAARLDRRNVDPRDVEVLLDDDLGILERLVGAGLVADLPVPDVVVFLFAIFADEGGARLQRFDGIDDDRQGLVVDLDRVDAVGRDVSARRHDRGDLLGLIEDRVGRKDHLLCRS